MAKQGNSFNSSNNKTPTYAADDPRNPQFQDKARKDAARVADLQRQLTERDTLQKMNVNKGPGYEALAQNEFEKQAGVTPPGWSGMRDVKTGQLLDQYKINPFAGEASQKIRAEALGTGPSEWAKNALGKQQFEQGQQMGAAGLQSQQAQSQARAALMQQGGLGGGARTSLARSGARDQLMAQQNVGSAGALARYGINDTDAKRRQELLGTTADVERGADIQNLGTTRSDLENRAKFDVNRYNEQMKAWGAKQSADATRAAGSSGGGGGGCFITTAVCEFMGLPDDNAFLNAFRKFRDEYMGGKHSEELKEYYALADRLGPLIKNDDKILTQVLSAYLVPCFLYIKEKDNEKVRSRYKQMIAFLKTVYGIDT